MSRLLRIINSDGHIRSMEEIEYAVLRSALERYRPSEAAKRLGIGRSTFYRKIIQYGLKIPRRTA